MSRGCFYNDIRSKLTSKQGIFLIRCSQNNKSFVSQSVNVRKRAMELRREMVVGTNVYLGMEKDYLLHGEDGFSVEFLEEVKDKSRLDDRQDYWARKINGYDPDRGYNVCPIVRKEENVGVFHGEKVIGSDNGNSKLTEKDVVEICALLNEGNTLVSIAKKFNTTYQAIASIRKGRTWRKISEMHLERKLQLEA